jgi:hypothetical protein
MVLLSVQLFSFILNKYVILIFYHFRTVLTTSYCFHLYSCIYYYTLTTLILLSTIRVTTCRLSYLPIYLYSLFILNYSLSSIYVICLHIHPITLSLSLVALLFSYCNIVLVFINVYLVFVIINYACFLSFIIILSSTSFYSFDLLNKSLQLH